MKKLNLLILDDDLLFLEYFDRLIAQNFENYQVLKASSLSEFNKLIEKNKIDIACLDIHLQGSDSGKEAAVMLRKMNPQIPLIFITGYAFENFSDLEVCTYLSKPLQVLQLKEALLKANNSLF